MNYLTDVNMVIYHNEYPVAMSKADHVGFMGIYFKNIFLSYNYPIGTQLDVGFVWNKNYDANAKRVPMIVNKTDNNGTGLTLKSFDESSIHHWKKILTFNYTPLVTSIEQ